MGGTPSKGTSKDGRLAANQGSKKSGSGKATPKGSSSKGSSKPTPPWMGKGGK